jgi:predicted Zn-dependent protease with MMP-like domain
VTSYATLSESEWNLVDQVWDLLDQGEVDRARARVDALLRGRPGHPDLRIVDAAVRLDEGEPELALECLRGAERSADPAIFFHLRALAHFELVQLDRARDDALRAAAVNRDLAEAHDLLARIYEHLGEDEKAQEHAAEARAIDPAAFAPPLEVSGEEFDAIVEESLKELPDEIRRKLDEVPVVVEDLPSRAVLTAEHPPLAPDVLGLFVGRHLLERSHLDLPGAPGAIYLFRRNLLRACLDREELKREVRTTVRHEVGHLLGLDEDELDDWGLG